MEDRYGENLPSGWLSLFLEPLVYWMDGSGLLPAGLLLAPSATQKILYCFRLLTRSQIQRREEDDRSALQVVFFFFSPLISGKKLTGLVRGSQETGFDVPLGFQFLLSSSNPFLRKTSEFLLVLGSVRATSQCRGKMAGRLLRGPWGGFSRIIAFLNF